ncbi:MAG: transglutaminase domain-containing protein [Myxococcales bacterium]|nr:transglutaminase domain-containing protein [Myxococcales bacterium]
MSWAALLAAGAAAAGGKAVAGPAECLGPEERSFTLQYEVRLEPVPEGRGPIDVFVPLAQEAPEQEVLVREIRASIPGEQRTESKFGTRFWHGHLHRSDGREISATVEYQVVRRAVRRTAPADADYSPEDLRRLSAFLSPQRLVPTAGPLVDHIRRDLPKASSPRGRARAVYDYVIDHMEYKKVGRGWGNGSTYWACSARYGNCTDFHALFVSLARAEGIPTRFEIGFPVPVGPKGRIDGYHCWAQVYLPGAGWLPVDASEAWKRRECRDSFFGAQPADRVLFSVERDLWLGDGHRSGPLNFFVYPHVELEGKPYRAVKTSLNYKEDPGL